MYNKYMHYYILVFTKKTKVSDESDKPPIV